MFINFIKILVGVVLALALFGVVWGVDLVYLIASLILLRCWVLFRHWLIKPATASDWDALEQSFREEIKLLDFEALVQLKSELDLPANATQEEMVATYIQEAKKTYRPPRVKVELLCELVGIVSYLERGRCGSF